MEKIPRCIGNVSLYFANAIHEAKNTVESFFFGILLEGNDFNEMKSFYPSTKGRSQTFGEKRKGDDFIY